MFYSLSIKYLASLYIPVNENIKIKYGLLPACFIFCVFINWTFVNFINESGGRGFIPRFVLKKCCCQNKGNVKIYDVRELVYSCEGGNV